jgi:transcription antitermination factor NusG
MQLEDLRLHLEKLAAQTTQAAIRNPYAAEIGAAMAHWHVLSTVPGQERIAASHLAARRFGIYLPENEQTVVARGVKRQRRRLLIPGYVFVFVWGIAGNFRRICACPGVSRLLFECGRPAVIEDEEIDQLAALEWSSTLCGPLYKPPKRARKHRVHWNTDPITVSTRSYAPAP